MPTGRTRAQSTSVLNRTRSPRLNGADLYVARFGGFSKTREERPSREKHHTRSPSTKPSTPEPLIRSSSHPSASEGSLHDELVDPFPKIQTQSATKPAELLDPAMIHASRPCYRCVAYMNSVGIRRVHWTNDLGQWESAKVRDLVDTLNGDGADAPGSGCGMFVTKHEVLMMRRLMGGN